jgi:hypothetical protein
MTYAGEILVEGFFDACGALLARRITGRVAKGQRKSRYATRY